MIQVQGTPIAPAGQCVTASNAAAAHSAVYWTTGDGKVMKLAKPEGAVQILPK